MTKRQAMITDFQSVASKLKHTPTRDQYTANSKFTKHNISDEFGTFGNLLEAAGLKPEPHKITDEDGYKVAKLQADLDAHKSYVKELQREVMNTRKLRDLIGAPDTTRLTDKTDWMNGPRKVDSGLSGIPTLFISDVHFDEVVKREQVNGINEYNREIATARLKHTFQRSVDLLKRYMIKPRYDGIILALGGDLVSGTIHDELKESNQFRINQTILEVTDLLTCAIAGIADEFGKVFVPCVVGNHGRMNKKPTAKNYVYDNFEWLIYQYLARHFKGDSRVGFLIPDGLDAIYKAYSRTYCLTHGNQFRGGTGISGIFTPLMLGMSRKLKRQNAVGQPFDTMICGHFHQLIMSEGLIVNGSVKGYDEYADAMNFPFEPAQQGLWITHPSGKITMRLPVYCEDLK